jgi:hypothetical protein
MDLQFIKPYFFKISSFLQAEAAKLKPMYLQVYAVSFEVIANPIEFWKIHKDTDEKPELLLKEILLPLFALVALSVFFGTFFRGDYFSAGMGFLWIIREILLNAVLYFGGVYITREIIKHYGYEAEIPVLQKLVSYSLIPHLVVSIVTGLFPFFFFLDFFGLYGLYVFWLGGRKLFPFPKETRDKYIIRIMAATWLIFALVSLLSARILIGND